MIYDAPIIANRNNYERIMKRLLSDGDIEAHQAMAFLLARCGALTQRLQQVKNGAK